MTEQQPLFAVPAGPRKPRTHAEMLESIVPLYAPNQPRPWDPIDDADVQLGWEHPYVDHRRAVEIRKEIDGAAG